MAHLGVKNWDRFQQYKDGRPVHWIKLHLSLLSDYDFSLLSDTQKAHLILIWALAAKLDNKIPSNPTWIGRQIQASEPVDVENLVSAGFLIMYEDEDESVRNCTSPYGEVAGTVPREEKRREEKRRCSKEHCRAATRLCTAGLEPLRPESQPASTRTHQGAAGENQSPIKTIHPRPALPCNRRGQRGRLAAGKERPRHGLLQD